MRLRDETVPFQNRTTYRRCPAPNLPPIGNDDPGVEVTKQRLTLGRRAEKICRRRLWWAGWKILDSNWHTSFGEIDLIAIERRTLVFVEVKSAGPGWPERPGPERPVLAVDPAKQSRLTRLAEAWLATEGSSGRVPSKVQDVRFDVVGIVFGEDGSVAAWEHLRDAFRAEGS